MNNTSGIDHSQTFMGTTGLNLHGTGEVTKDHGAQRQADLHAIRVMHKRGVLDVYTLRALFKPDHERKPNHHNGFTVIAREDRTERIQAAIDQAVGELR